MPILDIFSRRKTESEKQQPDVYQYDRVPDRLRVQIRRILEDSIGGFEEPSEWGGHIPNNNDAWDFVRDAITREHGTLSLANKRYSYPDCIAFLQAENNVLLWLDLVELSFRYVDRIMRDSEYKLQNLGAKQKADDAIQELNVRFKQSSFGYQYVNGSIIRIDSELVHSEIVRPALQFLSDRRFSGAQEEFVSAHAHYRAGEYKDCVSDALNAFESVLKTICELQKWDVPKGARAAELIKIVRSKGLLPDYLDNSFDQLIATLQSGLPKVRNEEGGHGQGAKPRQTPPYVAAYALHLSAAKILLLAEAFRALSMAKG